MNDSNPNDVTQDLQSRPQESATTARHPQRIGRYRIDRVLGQGGFGIVYLAQDEQLNRPVAVKVPHATLISKPEDAEMYLTEARTVANLDHPGIVPVHDVGSTEEFPCYVVSKYIPGTDLATRLKQKRLSYREAVELVATVADALHYAHKQGLVHRDVKPGNILIGNEGQPFVVDFGLALREENIGKGPEYAGTPAYMSPEQARGEGHRVDGRSDIFSLGIVFYELLAGRPPFRGDTKAELREQVTSYEPRPLLQYDERIPKELQRICFKALSKRASERYSSAHELAQDLRHFLADQTEIQGGSTPGGIAAADLETHATTPASTLVTTPSSGFDSSDTQPIKIVPKGLRSFDAHDADFFLELLPGPRDREGLPDSLRFWKTRIEETDADNTFTVGLIYGPSGCGKSSLVKAGLLPRLSEDVISVYIEATPEETETRLLHGLRKRCPALEDNLSLKATLAALRRGQGIPVGKKVLIVLDQLEQWLHAKKEEENSDLVQALRQCDGSRVQCIVMVRVDFWLAVSRFLRELEVRLVEGHNITLADLFDLDHARKVLAAFGRAFGKLPDPISETTKDQKEFIKQSVAGLAEEGKVICVRLALFAEMIKGKSWTPATLKEVGGTSGVGVTFLDETFSSPLASPEHRYHQKAARAVLKDLLPDSGTDIKGYMRSHAELLEASGYDSRQKDFDDLIRILDSEIRLITPTDPEGKEIDDDSMSHTQAGQKYFQLTHDYLVHSLRDWLTRKQKETRKGRAELKLFDTSLTWNAKPENRFLPSLTEWLNIRTLTDRKRWTQPQRAMIRRADRFHLSRLTSAVVLLALITATGLWTWHRVDQNRRELLAEKAKEQEATRIEGLVGRLVSAEPNQLPGVIKELDADSEIAANYLSPLLTQQSETLDGKRSQLHARLVKVARDQSLVEPLLEELLTNRVAYIGPIRQQLRPYAGELTERLWDILRDEIAVADRRFRAALALADYVPESEAGSWSDEDLTFVARQLVSANAEFQPLLRENLRPIHRRLLPDLATIFGDPTATDAQRLGAANAFADYAAKDVLKLVQLLTVATPEQYSVLYPLIVKANVSVTSDSLMRTVRETPAEGFPQADRISLGKRRAGAAITLLRQGEREPIFDALRVSTDPELLSQFVAGCKSRGVTAKELVECADKIDITRQALKGKSRKLEDKVLYGLLLALGEYPLEQIPLEIRSNHIQQLRSWYATDPSSSIHGASGWLLRRWNFIEETIRVDQTPIAYDPSGLREWFTLVINPETDDIKTKAEPAHSSIYFTFIIFPAGEYLIGSPDGESRRKDNENLHRVKLSRPIAVSDRELTWQQYDPFDNRSRHNEWENQFNRKLGVSEPAFGISWYESITYCRWLTAQAKLPEEFQCYDDPSKLPKDGNENPEYSKIYVSRSGFRLPTEAEWEVACRSDTQTAYSFGSDEQLLGDYGWFQLTSREWSHPVGLLRPGPRGLFDVHGNVDEWCHDWFGGYDLDEVNPDPLGAEEGSFRVFRGGSWYWDAGNSRSACRNGLSPSNRVSRVSGFRVALSPSAQSLEADKEGK